jgi:CBS domain-containing protein
MSGIVRDVMTIRVVAVKKDATFKDMAARLKRYRVSAFPVVDDDGFVIGVVSEADLLAKEALVAADALRSGPIGGLRRRKERSRAGGLTAADLMTAPPVTISAEQPVSAAAQLMYSRKVKRLPVVDASQRLVGIVSRADVLSVYDRPDADIRRDIEDTVILDRCLTDPGRFTVTVTNGIVTLEGNPETGISGHDIVAGTWHVEGVVSVRDRMVYPPAAAEATGIGPLFLTAGGPSSPGRREGRPYLR